MILKKYFCSKTNFVYSPTKSFKTKVRNLEPALFPWLCTNPSQFVQLCKLYACAAQHLDPVSCSGPTAWRWASRARTATQEPQQPPSTTPSLRPRLGDQNQSSISGKTDVLSKLLSQPSLSRFALSVPFWTASNFSRKIGPLVMRDFWTVLGYFIHSSALPFWTILGQVGPCRPFWAFWAILGHFGLTWTYWVYLGHCESDLLKKPRCDSKWEKGSNFLYKSFFWHITILTRANLWQN